MSYVIEFENVSKSYGSKSALSQLSFQVTPGEFVAFLGPNGAGKSTTISLILGLRLADSGEVKVLSGSPQSRKIRQNLGATLQDLDFPTHLKCSEIVKWVAQHYNCQSDYILKLKNELLLSEFWNREAGGLSGGERRRLGLLLGMMPQPKLLVLDEPTTGMDIMSRRAMWDCIRQYHSLGNTVLLTTHYLDEVEALASRVLIIDNGQLLFSGSVAEIRMKVDYKKIHIQSEAEHIYNWPGVRLVEQKGKSLYLLVQDSDAFVRKLVDEKIQFSHLMVQPASLEEAFLALRTKS